MHGKRRRRVGIQAGGKREARSPCAAANIPPSTSAPRRHCRTTVGATHASPVCRSPLKTNNKCKRTPWRVSRAGKRRRRVGIQAGGKREARSPCADAHIPHPTSAPRGARVNEMHKIGSPVGRRSLRAASPHPASPGLLRVGLRKGSAVPPALPHDCRGDAIASPLQGSNHVTEVNKKYLT